MMKRRSRKPTDQNPEKKSTLPLSARAMGIYILGARGSGKSRLSARIIAWQDYRAEIPLVVIDPLGGTIDNFLDKLYPRGSGAVPAGDSQKQPLLA
jgi:hypothetical protein